MNVDRDLEQLMGHIGQYYYFMITKNNRVLFGIVRVEVNLSSSEIFVQETSQTFRL
jgi:hypothetical protein